MLSTPGLEVRDRPHPPERVAVIGSGVAGLTAAYLLSRTMSVTLYEADDRLGGHAHTHDVAGPDGPMPVDTGFIVHNDRTYPVLRRLFTELGVTWRPTEMSLSIRDDDTGLEYAGGRGLPGFVARPRQLASPEYLRLLLEVRRFHQVGREFLERTDDEDGLTFGELLTSHGFSPSFIRRYAVPVVSCVWSTGGAEALDYPARYLLRFLSHHGMLSVGNSPTWATVRGGSRVYVEAIASRLDAVRMGHRVESVLRDPDLVSVTDNRGVTQHFDKVVIATHPDQALDLLDDATPQEKEVLGAFRYTRSQALLHTDPSLLPRARAARSSWNFLVRSDGTGAPLVTYWLNRLQGLPASHPLFVTLNGADLVSPRSVIAKMDYAHPAYDLEAVRAQRLLPGLSTGRTAFAGAYHGWGFHEDGARSGVAAAAAFGVAW